MSDAMLAAATGAVVGASSGRRRNPYVQAALMYPRRWLFRVVALWTVGLLALSWWKMCSDSGHWAQRDRERASFVAELPQDRWADEVAGIGAVIALMVLPGAVAVAGHVKERVSGWEGRVVPGYRRPHLAVGAGAMGAVIVAVALTVEAAVPFSWAGVFGVTAGTAALGAACAALPPRGVASVGVGSVVILSLREVRYWVACGFLGARPGVADAMLAGALVWLAAVWGWMAMARGERRARSGEDLMLGEQFVGWRRRAGEDVSTMRLARRVRLWRAASSSGLMPLASGAALLALVVGIVMMHPATDRENYIGVAVALCGLSIVLPVGAVATQWGRRMAGFGYEMSRPVTRRRFVRDAGLAMAWDWAAWWGWLTLGGMMGFAYTVHAVGERGPRWRAEDWVLTVVLVAGSAAVQMLLYGVVASVMSSGARWSVYCVALIGGLTAWWPVMYVGSFVRNYGPTTAAAGCTAIAAAGALATWAGYRRWVCADVA